MYKIAVMSFFGVSKEAAVAGAIALHAISNLPVALLGMVFMAKEGLSFGRMREMAQQEAEVASEGRRDPARSGGPIAQRGGEVWGPTGRSDR
jgi:hypothetical protein